MAPRTAANPASLSTALTSDLASVADPDIGTITPDLAMVLQDAKPHPQLGTPAPQPPSTAQLGNAAAAIAAGLTLEPRTDADLSALLTSYLLPPGTRARVHRAGPSGVLLLAPSALPRAVAMAAPGVYVVVEIAG